MSNGRRRLVSESERHDGFTLEGARNLLRRLLADAGVAERRVFGPLLVAVLVALANHLVVVLVFKAPMPSDSIVDDDR